MTKDLDNNFDDEQIANQQSNDRDNSLDDKFADKVQIEKNKQARMRIEALQETKRLKELLNDSNDW